jgi:manganese/zinc/iron transport system permease protein
MVLVANLLFVLSCYKELKISAFDPALSTAVGIPSTVMHYLLTTMVAITAVASFEAVGNILVVAMLVVPPATAYLCTDRLAVMIPLSALFAACSAVLGHWSAIGVPALFGFNSTTTAGMMAVSAGLLFAGALLFAPRQGILPRYLRQRSFAWRVMTEDILATLYRMEERSELASFDAQSMEIHGVISLPRALDWLVRQGSVTYDRGSYRLTDSGRQAALRIVRSHRLWESYLAQEAGLPSDRIHDRAEQLEHFTDRAMRAKLDRQTADTDYDPHGAPIPPES